MQQTRNSYFGVVLPLLRLLPAMVLLPVILATLAPAPPAEAANPPVSVTEPTKKLTGAARASFIVTTTDAMSESAEDIFNQAQAGKMDRSRKDLDNIKKSAASLDTVQGKDDFIMLPRLKSTIDELEKAIAGKNRLDTMRSANRITLIAATLAVPFNPDLPTELSILGYNDRELAIWSEVKITDRFSTIVIRMHLAWQTLMPKLIEHHGEKDLKRFSEIMEHLEQAKTSEEYGRLSRQVLVEVDSMKAIFTKPAKAGNQVNPGKPAESGPRRKPLPPKQGAPELTEPQLRK